MNDFPKELFLRPRTAKILAVGRADKEIVGIHSLRVGWRNFFPVVLLCQIFVLAGNRFWFYLLLMLLEYHTVVVLC